jgi:hypothetical protein
MPITHPEHLAALVRTGYNIDSCELAGCEGANGAGDMDWVCVCGDFHNGDCHCPRCGQEAPWGCDCGFADELYDTRHPEEEYDEDLWSGDWLERQALP